MKTLHRIDELSVIRDVERAGFHHAGDADFLRNPADTRDWNDSPREAGERRGTSDRFVLEIRQALTSWPALPSPPRAWTSGR